MTMLPVGLATDATDIPRKVRVLGEELILFRNKHGRAHLLWARCCQRGTTLLPRKRTPLQNPRRGDTTRAGALSIVYALNFLDRTISMS